MTISDRYAVVAAPFPYVEREVIRRRPAVLVSTVGGRHGLAWVLMVTSAANPPWPDDIRITDLERAGLKAPSVVRPAKIATVELDRLARIGELDEHLTSRLKLYLATNLGLCAG